MLFTFSILTIYCRHVANYMTQSATTVIKFMHFVASA